MTHIDPVLTVVPLALLLWTWLCRRSLSKRLFRAGLLLCLVLLYWVSWPGAWLSSASLEKLYQPRDMPEGEAEAIVVFAGGVELPYPSHPRADAEEHTYWRTRHAAWLYHHWRQLPIVVCGGPASREPGAVVLAEVMRDVLVHEGVPAEQIWLEARSGDTYENALFAAQLLRQKGIRRAALVTEGYHMLRSEACLRKAGIEVVPAPCCFFTQRPISGPHDSFPSGKLARRNYQVLHEWIGFIWYWIRGRV